MQRCGPVRYCRPFYFFRRPILPNDPLYSLALSASRKIYMDMIEKQHAVQHSELEIFLVGILGYGKSILINSLLEPKLKDNEQIRCAVVGKVGSGKSRLVNSMLSSEVAEDCSSISGGTASIFDHEGEIQLARGSSYRVKVIDTPGLQHPMLDTDQVLKNIQSNLDESYVALVCFNITQERIFQDDIIAIRSLTKTLGDRIWKKAVFVLTFANELVPFDENIEVSSEGFYDEKKEAWRSILLESLLYVGVSQEDAVQVPVVLAGLGQKQLPYSKPGADWLTDLWTTCCIRASETKGC